MGKIGDGKNPRVVFQNSVFVHAPRGYISGEYETIAVNQGVKSECFILAILTGLEKSIFPSPQSLNSVLVKCSVRRYNNHVVSQCLGNEHAVKWVAMRPWKLPGAFGVDNTDGEFFETLAGDA